MSFNDKKTLVILKVIYKLVELYYFEEDKDVLLHRINLLFNEYKIELRKAEYAWISHYSLKIGNQLADLKIEATAPLILSVLFRVAENYRMILKNPRRIVAWESLENFLAKHIIVNDIKYYAQYDLAEKIEKVIFNDQLFL